MQIYLLKNYRKFNRGEIIRTTNSEAQVLLDQGVARKVTNRDFLVKPEMGAAKSFAKPPSKGGIKKLFN